MLMLFIETSVFTREIKKQLSDEVYRELQNALMLRPDAGDIIKGSGGLRKLRWHTGSKGKCGGLRIIYYWDMPDKIYLLLPYGKSDQEDLTIDQLKVLKAIVKESLL